MLQELTAATGAGTAWAIGSFVFFSVVFAFIAIRVMSRGSSHYEQQARLPLEDAQDDGAR